MKRNIPDYFVLLVKQYTNSTSELEAERTTEAVVGSILASCDSTNRIRVNYLLPDYLCSNEKKVFRLSREIQMTMPANTYIKRVKTQLQLSDDSEVRHKTTAILKSLSVVMSARSYNQLLDFLPPYINELNTQ